MKKDIFDRLMSLPVLRFFEPFYQKHKEVLLYLFFGGLTFLVSIGSFILFTSVMELHELIANVFSWILAVLFAFFTNRIWVFSAPADTPAAFIRQMVSFFTSRLATLGIEELILLLGITCLHLDKVAVKTVAQVIVIVLNYVLSKIWVFHKKA